MNRVGGALCLDASVGAKWFFRDEPDSRFAVILLERCSLGDLVIVVPDLFFYEVGSILSVGVRRKRLFEMDAVQSLQELADLNLECVSLRGETDSALLYSRRLGISFYDATYLAVAESRGVPLVTCDRKLLEVASPNFDWVITSAAAADL